MLQHFFVRAFLLCSTFLQYSKTPRQKCGQEGPLNHFFLLRGGMFGLSRGLRPSQNRDPKKDLVLEGSKAQRGRLDGEIPPYFARLERGHLPVICLGKTKRNPRINSELILGFRLVFYRETKLQNVVLEIDFGFRFRTHFGARRTVWVF